MFKRKKYKLRVTIRQGEEIFVINHCGYKKIGYKKIIYKYDRNNETVMAKLIDLYGQKSIIKYKSVIEVEKIQINDF